MKGSNCFRACLRSNCVQCNNGNSLRVQARIKRGEIVDGLDRERDSAAFPDRVVPR